MTGLALVLLRHQLAWTLCFPTVTASNIQRRSDDATRICGRGLPASPRSRCKCSLKLVMSSVQLQLLFFSSLDDEFDKQFYLPEDSDGGDIKWRCPINFFVFQQLCMQFIDFRQRGSPSLASALPLSIHLPNAVLPSNSVSTSTSSTLTPLLEQSVSMPAPAPANAHAWSRMRPKAT